MMNSLNINILLAVIWLSVGYCNAAESICTSPKLSQTSNTYFYQFSKNPCAEATDCWISFQPPEDTIRISINGMNTISFDRFSNYINNEYLLLPIPSTTIVENIVIDSRDLNQLKTSPNELCIQIGHYHELRAKSASSWFFRTGATLYSTYFLCLTFLFLILTYSVTRSSLALVLLTYCATATVYLVSFSEYPRAYFNPVLLSGGIHFPLRLLQDLSLVHVFFTFYQEYGSKNLVTKITWVYSLVIATYILLLAIGVTDYKYYERIIFIFAPLVAAPMAVGTWLSLRSTDKTERKLMIPASIVLLLFQINDLLVFWRLSSGYFTVRLYIPFVIGMILFLYFRKTYRDSLKAKTHEIKSVILKEFLHDIKSPIAVMRVFENSHSNKNSIVSAAIDRIENLAASITLSSEEADLSKLALDSIIGRVVQEKRVEYTNSTINWKAEVPVFVFGNETKLHSIFSNIINNSMESYPSGYGHLDIKLVITNQSVRIQFSDNGKGMSDWIQERIKSGDFSTKPTGQGLGLASAKRYLESTGGQLNIYSKEHSGTTIEIQLLTSEEITINSDLSLSASDVTPSEPYQNLDFVLIDDDKYICASWEYYAVSNYKKIKTYRSVEEFIIDSSNVSKTTTVYLDVNLHGVKSIDKIGSIYALGFHKIVLATGENFEESMIPKYVHSVIGKLPPVH